MNTKIFLAATSHVKTPIVGDGLRPHYILESFMDLRTKSKTTEEYIRWCLTADDFLLDSGAFAFMNKASKTKDFSTADLQQYIKDYAAFINKWDIQNFFEMDLDCVIGYEKVKKVRAWLERKTGKKPIPVWHISRGIDDFHEMCKEYKYVAIGGIASKEFPRKEHYKFQELCDIAHSYGCKIHGLGYLPLEILNNGTCPFDTVDGTSWQGHMRANKFVLNEDGKISKETDVELQQKQRTWKDNEREGFKVWTKFSKIVENK